MSREHVRCNWTERVIVFRQSILVCHSGSRSDWKRSIYPNHQEMCHFPFNLLRFSVIHATKVWTTNHVNRKNVQCCGVIYQENIPNTSQERVCRVWDCWLYEVRQHGDSNNCKYWVVYQFLHHHLHHHHLLPHKSFQTVVTMIHLFGYKKIVALLWLRGLNKGS